MKKTPSLQLGSLKLTAAAVAVLLALASGTSLASDVSYDSIGSYGSGAASQPVLNITGDTIEIGTETSVSTAIQVSGKGNSIVVSAEKSLSVQNAGFVVARGYTWNKPTIEDYYLKAEETGGSTLLPGEESMGSRGSYYSLALDSNGPLSIINHNAVIEAEDNTNAIQTYGYEGSITINKNQTATQVTIIGDIYNYSHGFGDPTGTSIDIWLTGDGSVLKGNVLNFGEGDNSITLAPQEGGTALFEGDSWNYYHYTLTAGSGATIRGETTVKGEDGPDDFDEKLSTIILTGNAVQEAGIWGSDVGYAEMGGTLRETTGPGTRVTGDFETELGSWMVLKIGGTLTGKVRAGGGGQAYESFDDGCIVNLELSGTWNGDLLADPGRSELWGWIPGEDIPEPGTGTVHVLNGGVWNGNATAVGPYRDGSTLTHDDYGRDYLDKLPDDGRGGIVKIAVDAGGDWTGNSEAQGTRRPDSTDKGSSVTIEVAGNWTGSAVSGAATAAPADKSGGYTDVTVTAGGTWTGDITAQESTLEGQTASSGSADVKIAGTWTGASTASTDTTLTDPAIVNVTLTEPTGLWNMTRDSSVTALDIGSGKVNFTRDEGTFAGKTLTVAGNYTGNGGTIAMNTVLAGDDAATDKLVVKGNTAGTTTLTFTNVGGAGAQTVDGIRVVQVGGTSDGVFTKSPKNFLKAGPYVYHLEKIGTDWYLVSTKETPILPWTTDKPETPDTPDTPDTPSSDLPDIIPGTGDVTTHVIRPGVASYANNLYAANTLFNMSLYERLGDTVYSDALRTKDDTRSGNVWLRAVGGHTRNKMEDGQLTTRGNWGVVQVGGDVVD